MHWIYVIVFIYYFGETKYTVVTHPSFTLVQREKSTVDTYSFSATFEDYGNNEFASYSEYNGMPSDTLTGDLDDLPPYLIPDQYNGLGIHSVKDRLIDRFEKNGTYCFEFEESYEAQRLDILQQNAKVQISTWCEVYPELTERQIKILNHMMPVPLALQRDSFEDRRLFIFNQKFVLRDTSSAGYLNSFDQNWLLNVKISNDSIRPELLHENLGTPFSDWKDLPE